MHRRNILSLRADISLADRARHSAPQAVTLMVGPEGGFSDAEDKLALSMGPRNSRTKTAALAALAAAWGGMWHRLARRAR